MERADQILPVIARFLPRKVISDPRAGTPYMTRYLLEGEFGEDTDAKKGHNSVYLHHYHRPDWARDLHCHPWPWARSLILCGGYVELRARYVAVHNLLTKPEEFTYRQGDTNYIESGDYHVINELHGDTWTLFVTGPSDRPWYFWKGGKPVHFKEYIGIEW